MILLNRIIFFAFFIQPGFSLILKETDFNSSKNWEFLTRFCFIDGATINITIEFPSSYTNQKLLFYHDGYQSWSDAYNSAKSCEDKVNVLDQQTSQVQELDASSSRCQLKSSSYGDTVVPRVCKLDFSFKLNRPTWWFIAMSNCGDERGLAATYDMLLQNGKSIFYRHYSCDEFYVLRAVYVFLFIYIGLAVVVSIFLHRLRKTKRIIYLYVMLLISVLSCLVQFIFASIYWTRYGITGIPKNRVRSIGYGFWIIGHSVFVCILLLTSVGYCVVYTVFPKFVLFSLITGLGYVILQFIVYLFQETTFDPGEIVYRSETAYGITLEILRLILFVVFLVFCVMSAKKFIKRRKFFIIFSVLFGLWFLSIPIMVLLGSLVIVDYARERVVIMFDFSITVIGHMLFLILTRPTRANKLVKFMKTGAVGITIEDAETQDIQENMSANGEANCLSNYGGFPAPKPFPSKMFETNDANPNIPDAFQNEIPPPPIYNTNGPIFNIEQMRNHMDSLFTTNVDLQNPDQTAQDEHPIMNQQTDKAIDSTFVFPSAM